MQLRNGSSSSSFGWFYELLDTERALGIAVTDARRCSTVEQVMFSFVINVILAVFFAFFWVRYDLWSTSTIFLPVVDKAAEAIPTGGVWDVAGFVIRMILGVAASLFTTLLQAAYPRLATQYKGAMWGLGFSIIFDIATDYRDVATDFPTWFKPLIDAAAQAEPRWWAIAIVVLILGLLIMPQKRALFWLLIIVSGACLVMDPATVWTYLVIFFMTIFCSFVVQGLFVLHAGKCVQLLARGRSLRAAAVD